MNSTEFQIIRWGIPGWIFIVTIGYFKLSVHDMDVISLMQVIPKDVMTGVAALFAGLGIPVGYVLYQVYYCLKWDSPFFFRNKAYEAANGIHTLNSFLTRVPADDWKVIEGYFDHIMTVEVTGKQVEYSDLKRRYDSYSNRTSRIHGLGSSIIALIAGLLAFLFITNLSLVNFKDFIELSVPYVLTIVFLYRNFYVQNLTTFKQINELIKDIANAPDKP